MNVNTETGDPGKVAKVITESAADILALEEINDRWLLKLADALRSYPYSKVMTREDNFGIGLFSKFPLISCEVRQLGEAEVPSIIAEVDLPDGKVTIIATHPLPPGGAEYSHLRNDQLARLSPIVKEARSPVLLLGDLNVTPWSSYFKTLLKDSNLIDSSRGHGVLPTWQTFLPPAMIPIDHCLYTQGIRITGKTLGSRTGSDHYPVIVDFVISKPPAGVGVRPQ